MSAVDPRPVGVRADAPLGAGPRLASGRFLRSELDLIFRRRRNVAGLAVLAAVPILIAVAVRISGSGGGGPSFIDAITRNGIFVAFAALAIELTLFLPLAVATIAGDSVAGEANLGTLRYLLTVPAGRTRLLAVKYAAIVIFTVVATLLVAVVGVLVGVIFFGAGPVTLLSGTQIGFAAGLGRLLLVVLYLAAGFAALGAIGLFVSTLTEQPIAAMVTTVLVNVVMFVCDSLSQLDAIHPYLLTHWWTSFGDLLRDPVATDGIQHGLLTALVYAAVFWLAAWARFSSKDVTS